MPSHKRKFSMSERNIMVICIGLCLGLLYLPVWRIDYFYHDDLLFWLKNGLFGSFVISDQLMAFGRFLCPPLFTVVGWGVNSIADLKVLRLLNVIGLAFFAAMTFNCLLKFLSSRLQCFLAALILCTLPAFALIASWALCVLVPWVWLLSFCASMVPFQGIRDRRAWGAALLFFLAVCIYPSAAMMYWPGVFLSSFLGREGNHKHKIVLGLLVIGLYGIVTQIFLSFYAQGSGRIRCRNSSGLLWSRWHRCYGVGAFCPEDRGPSRDS
jgi:hypothetical protein